MSRDGPPVLPANLGAADWRPLDGGDTSASWRVRLDDGRDVVVKQGPHPAEWEAEGLGALADAGVPVPEVVAAEANVLVIAHVAGTPHWEGLGAALAAAHRRRGEAFGWHRDNAVGLAAQRNSPDADWASFYGEQRVRPHLDAPALPADLRRRLQSALDGQLQSLLDHDPAPSLVHGDLWAGNIVDGAWLIDPSVHHADREYDLAFATVFGGIPAAFFAGYEDEWPLPDGSQRRRPALQLHHLLVHVRLFGDGYVGTVAARLDALGW
ncbi:MAG: fructosamine kinase family protein [Egibacteraceae bacterium]